MELLREKKGFISDMDGVIYRGKELIPGVKEFVEWLQKEDKKFLFLTNNSAYTPKELQIRLSAMGIDVGEEHFYTSALATAGFIAQQHPGCRAYVIGDPGLIGALYQEGIAITETDPDYVIIGEGKQYTYETMCKAAKLVMNGAKLIGTNSDIMGPTDEGIVPACKSLVTPIELTTGKKAYYIGKPNPLIMRTALRKLKLHSEETAMIGDSMETDIISGIESGLDTVLVLSGMTTKEEVERFPYRPRLILNGVGDIPPTNGNGKKSKKNQ